MSLQQLHHQNKADRTKTEFCSQKDINSQDEFHFWVKDVTSRFPPPEGWEFLCCNERSKFFLMENGKE